MNNSYIRLESNSNFHMFIIPTIQNQTKCNVKSMDSDWLIQFDTFCEKV